MGLLQKALASGQSEAGLLLRALTLRERITEQSADFETIETDEATTSVKKN